ncbi:SAP domain-containing protein [Xenorhabdus bovienii]|uniref:hypothetical protein n=1 Tax=Xenorhabdus bovienii TaxID=40576 RepID=UPI00237CE883|nr:hypothetical protein [Xenorhabdus bovienii]MDE1485710.1 SAP domain-containing protein [Xenorhabdus bovienii]MDE1493460.1 SAP domain-containing protein [Xenorhabdus bovienii]MDE9444536.1 SAP domain-containing protein [Xenorhabdus bovienii]MDE9471556.1 SAP domain-containing protein [Xenorhabdus bovienii]MDE9476446.1 SAP domain-containing protein [Xenorhabdus bovienii]
MSKLYQGMSQEEFDGGYFYAKELKAFAKTLGITVGNLKKNELELHIKAHLFGYSGELPATIPNRKNSAARDLLMLDTPVVNYVSDKKTKSFLLAAVEQQFGALADKSGQWYWLNSWRKQCIIEGKTITYGDLVAHLANLKKKQGRLPQIPSARMNNFISDYISDSENQGSGKNEALKAWFELKASSLPKTYQAYKDAKALLAK